jgi:hypothetical protein
MKQRISSHCLGCCYYDGAIAFLYSKLHFDLIEDTVLNDIQSVGFWICSKGCKLNSFPSSKAAASKIEIRKKLRIKQVDAFSQTLMILKSYKIYWIKLKSLENLLEAYGKITVFC